MKYFWKSCLQNTDILQTTMNYHSNKLGYFSVGEKRQTFLMARFNCLMGNFTNLYRIYKAHPTNVRWTMEFFRLHWIFVFFVHIHLWLILVFLQFIFKPLSLQNTQKKRDSPTRWCLYALFHIYCSNFQLYVPFYVNREQIYNFMCLLEFKCAERLKVHSQAIPGRSQRRQRSICGILDLWGLVHSTQV